MTLFCRGHDPYAFCFDVVKSKRRHTALAMAFSDPQLLFTPAFAG
jgi:hypothetical protein